jgi:hypothetical protein
LVESSYGNDATKLLESKYAATKIAILYVIQIIFHLWDGKIGGSYKLDHDLDNCGMDI